MKDLLRVSKGDEGEGFISLVVNQCSTCVHWSPETPTLCEAFPDGIPIMILLGMFDHSRPYDIEGISDNGVLYEPKEDPNPTT